jgi:hypothetical protein
MKQYIKKVVHQLLRIKEIIRKKLRENGFLLSKDELFFYKIKDIHKGEKAVIIGMGPSLKISDLERLKGYTCFACNKIYLAFGETNWRPDYYSICDILVAQNNHKDIFNTNFGSTIAIHFEIVRPILKTNSKTFYYNCKRSLQNWKKDTTIQLSDLKGGTLYSGGCSVILDQLQIAYAMGFSEVYLLGIDFSFTLGNVKNEVCESGQIIESAGEVNHFHKDYRKVGEKWTMPMMEEQRNAFEFCESQFSKTGRKLLNASRNTMLDVIPKVDFDQAFPE